MSQAIEKLVAAQQRAMRDKPDVGGFPYLAEVLRKAGVSSNVWSLPSCQSLYLTVHGPVVQQGTPLAQGSLDVPPFDREALIKALRADQAGESSFPVFLHNAWNAGVVRYEVDLIRRCVTYAGCQGEE
ncbi:hypothetical protein AWB76_05750 [Caballeronia temeraria]|uniref:Uncharacterized protein n=1 Tax=Caballeronia temeraria TaxID=1777137 RepID=A0A158CMH6_9BURK|nr:DUF1398 family protein [Caballeronia temeraria]SAK83491.1 hypothetical protein AWB76_05750 [Caballeronia temeraria]